MAIQTAVRVPSYYDQVHYTNASCLFQVANLCENLVRWDGRYYVEIAPINNAQTKWKETKRRRLEHPLWVIACFQVMRVALHLFPLLFHPVFILPLLALHYIRFKARQISFQGSNAESFRQTETDFSKRIEQEDGYRKAVSAAVHSGTGLIPVLANLVTSYFSRADVFGREAWNFYFGVDIVGGEPPLPQDIDRILKSPSNLDPLKPNNTVADDFMLVLIPKKFIQVVDDKEVQLPLTLSNLYKLVLNIKSQDPIWNVWDCHRSSILREIDDITVDNSHWVLMSKEVLPGSRNKAYAAQQAQVATFSDQTGILYEVPTLLQAVTSIFAEYARTGIRLQIYTRCKETIEGLHWAVREFDRSLHIGLTADNAYYLSRDYGVAVVRRLS